MSQETTRQTGRSVDANIAFFRGRHASYGASVAELETYSNIRASLNQAITGSRCLIDIGNGGVCDYDTSLVHSVTAVDLFFDEMPPAYVQPSNVTLKTGSALAIPESDATFDCALMAMLLHHLVGPTARESFANIEAALREAHRVLQPGGRLVIVESCVAPWFYAFERFVFPLAAAVVDRLTGHPVTIQYPPLVLAAVVQKVFGRAPEVAEIPCGRWILQFGSKFPSALTAARPFCFKVVK